MDFKVQYDVDVVTKMTTRLGRTGMQDRKKWEDEGRGVKDTPYH